MALPAWRSVACPTICGNRLAYLSHKGDFSWALRDFITGRILRSGKSDLTLRDIEAQVTYSERPVYRSVERKNEWTRELVTSSQREFGNSYDGVTPPSNNAGQWRTL